MHRMTGTPPASAASSRGDGVLPRPLGWWPLRSFRELGALPGAVPCARRHARQQVSEWGLGRVGDDLELLVSELVTNAIAATRAMEPASPVQLWLLSDATRVAVLVWDASPRPPVLTQIDEVAESGRGLLLVEAISQRWGWFSTRGTIGKVIWATVT